MTVSPTAIRPLHVRPLQLALRLAFVSSPCPCDKSLVPAASAEAPAAPAQQGRGASNTTGNRGARRQQPAGPGAGRRIRRPRAAAGRRRRRPRRLPTGRFQQAPVRDPTTWTILEQDGPNHLGLWCNVLPEHQMALIISECVPARRLMSEFKIPRDRQTGQVKGAMVASWAWVGWAGKQVLPRNAAWPTSDCHSLCRHLC